VIVVSDSSPLITLSKIGHIHLLPAMYGSVHITPEVYSEVVVTGAGLWGAAEIAKAEWVRVKTADEDATVSAEDKAVLGMGDISTILLAKQLKAEVALIDDRRARALALRHNVTPLGCVGILHTAFLAGLVADLRKVYQLLLGSGAYVDRRIVESNLKALNLPGLET
jgi:predicted nucleic acid-binding protein